MPKSDLPNSIEAIRRLIIAQGWKLSYDDEVFETWRKDVFEEFSKAIALPKLHAHPNVHSLFSTLLEDVARVENVGVSELSQDLFRPSKDVVRIRVHGENMGSGTLPLSVAGDLIKATRSLFYAGAAAVEKKQSFFASKGTDKVHSYVKKLEISPFEKGSFVMNVLSPVDANLDLFGDSLDVSSANYDFFPRKATEMTMLAAQATDEAAKASRKEGRLDIFDSFVERGVSANLCDALGSIADAKPQSLVELNTMWAGVRPGDIAVPKDIDLGPNTTGLLHNAAKFMRGHLPNESEHFRGVVFLLREERKNNTHDIGLENISSEGPRKIRINLSRTQYEHAIEAHKHDQVIEVSGVVKKKGLFYRMADVESFEVQGTTLKTDGQRRWVRPLDEF